MRKKGKRHGLEPMSCPVQTSTRNAQAKDSGCGRLHAKHAQHNRQQQARQLLTDDTTERALAYARWNIESRCNDNSTLSQRIRHSNVTATPIATTRNWYCRGQYTAGSGDRIPPQRDTLSCTKSRQCKALNPQFHTPPMVRPDRTGNLAVQIQARSPTTCIHVR